MRSADSESSARREKINVKIEISPVVFALASSQCIYVEISSHVNRRASVHFRDKWKEIKQVCKKTRRRATCETNSFSYQLMMPRYCSLYIRQMDEHRLTVR